MGSCMSRRSHSEKYDDYYDPDEPWHYGDQSWQFYRAQDMEAFYESEFQPDAPKRKKTAVSGIRGKIESLRRSFFNQGSSLEQTPKPIRRDSKGLKGKFQNWRRSWFGPEQSPITCRKLSFNQKVYGSKDEPGMLDGKKFSLSQSSVNRLSVTRNFVEKHGEVEQVYRKLSKQSLSDETVLVHDLSPKSKVTPQKPQPEHTPEKIAPKVPTIDVEDEISEIKIHNRSAEREFLTKIKEIGSLDYYSDSDEDVSRLNEALEKSAEKLRECQIDENDSMIKGKSEAEKNDIEEEINTQTVFTSDKDKGIVEIKYDDGEVKDEEEDRCVPKDEEKLQEGLSLFNEEYNSENEEPTERRKSAGGECSDDQGAVRNGRQSEDSESISSISEEEKEAEEEPKARRVLKTSAISISSEGNRSASQGTRIQISSKGRT